MCSICANAVYAWRVDGCAELRDECVRVLARGTRLCHFHKRGAGYKHHRRVERHNARRQAVMNCGWAKTAPDGREFCTKRCRILQRYTIRAPKAPYGPISTQRFEKVSPLTRRCQESAGNGIPLPTSMRGGHGLNSNERCCCYKACPPPACRTAASMPRPVAFCCRACSPMRYYTDRAESW